MNFINFGWFKYLINPQSIFLHSGGSTDDLLQEDGFLLLQENGARINI